MSTTMHKNPCSGGNSIYNFGKLFLGHHYYTLNLSVLCLSEEKKILRELMHFHSMTYLATPYIHAGHGIHNLI